MCLFLLEKDGFILLNHDSCPAVFVGLDSILDVAKLLIKLAANGTRFAILRDDEALLGVEVVDALDGTDDGSSSASSSLLEGRKFFFGNLSALHLHAEVHSQLHQALVRDAGQDAAALRRDISVVLDAEEVGSAALVHVLLLFRIEIELAAVAEVVRHLVGSEAGCIVATHLIDASAERGRAVVLADDDIGIRGKAALEVWADRCDEDEEEVFAGRMNADLSARANQQRTDIERCSALIRWDEALIEAHHLVHHLVELFRRKFGHQDASASALQAGCVLVRTEHAHLSIRAAVSLQSLESLLPIMQTSSCHVQRNGLLAANLYLTPCAITIVAAHIVVCLHVTKREVTPIDFFHKPHPNPLQKRGNFEFSYLEF